MIPLLLNHAQAPIVLPPMYSARTPADPTVDTTPYTLPTTTVPASTTVNVKLDTYDGSGQATHPDVVDMVQETGRPWNGWRYWMAYTPYPDSQDAFENPCIAASQDGFTWYDPSNEGINPIDPTPPYAWNSDTELIWDPENECMVLNWRQPRWDNRVYMEFAVSTDGVNWEHQKHPALDFGVSQAIVRRGPGDWWAFGFSGTVYNTFRATSLLGTWTKTATTFYPWPEGSLPTGASMWHHNVIWHKDQFRMLACRKDGGGGYPAVSEDGVTWRASSQIVLGGSPYRPSMTVHENGTHYRTWYGALGKPWYIRYTTTPQSAWDVL